MLTNAHARSSAEAKKRQWMTVLTLFGEEALWTELLHIGAPDFGVMMD